MKFYPVMKHKPSTWAMVEADSYEEAKEKIKRLLYDRNWWYHCQLWQDHGAQVCGVTGKIREDLQ